MKTGKLIGLLLILSSTGVFVPYTILTFTFNYPNILREETGLVLTRFHAGGSGLIFTWLAFALLGSPLIISSSLLGKQLEKHSKHIRWITTIGIAGVVVQMIGLLRWVFVVPVLANQYVSALLPEERLTIVIAFKVMHQFAGVLLGEHLGQLFTVLWTVFTTATLLKTGIISKWLAWWGFVASFVYFLAQADLLATVIPSFPLIENAGFIGSTLWLIWLILVGIDFLKKDQFPGNSL
ncbi:MAG: DUF4386 domain-containing protein [Bacteroidota bacterium]